MFGSIGRKLPSPAIGAIVFAWLFFCWHWLSGADVIPFDSKLSYFQLTSWAVDCYRQGFLPLWDPYFMSGFPACADPQIHCFYVFATPLFAVLGPLQPVWFDRVELLHILAAGIGIYFLAREFKISPAAALLAALVAMFGGSASARLQHTGMIYAYGLLPLCLLLTKFVFERRNWLYVPILGLCAGSLGVLGDQVAFLNCIVVAAFAVALLVRAVVQKKSFKPGFFRLLVAGTLTLIVMLPQVVPTAELLPLSSRPWIPLKNLVSKSLYPQSFLTYLVPNIFRTFDGYVNYIGKNDPSETYLYIGLLPAAVLLYGGLFKRLFLRKEGLWFVLPLVFFFLYALGTQTPAYSAFWYLIPGVKSFQRPTDATFLINIFLALFISWTVDRLRFREPNSIASAGTVAAKSANTADSDSVRKKGTLIPSLLSACAFTAVVVVATVLACKYLVPNVRLHINNLAFVKLGIGMLLGVFMLNLLERVRERGIQNILVLFIALVTFADLQFQNSSTFLNTAPAAEYGYDVPSHVDQFAGLKVLERLRSPNDAPFRVETLGSETERLWWNTANHLQVQVTDGMWPINLLSYHQYAGACNPIFGRRFNHWMSGFDSPLFDLLNVKYVVTNFSSEKAKSVLKPDKFSPTLTVSQYEIYQNLKVLPRSFLVGSCKICHSLTELGEIIRSPNFMPRSEVLLLSYDVGDGADDLRTIADSKVPVTAQDEVQVDSYGQNDVTLSAHCLGSRMLVLGDIYFPGWTATVDGSPTRMYRADYLFRGVVVPAGDHKVRFKFNPYSFHALKEASRLANTR